MTEKELKELEKEIAELEAEGKNISIQNKMRLKKLQRKRDKIESPIKASAVFVSDSIEEQIKLIDIDKIMMPKFNDRTGIDKHKIRELAQSIKANGLLQPVIVLMDNSGIYTKIAGRRRILATKLNGENQIKAIIKKEPLTKKEFNLLVLHENTQREDLSIYDKVRFILNFIEQEFNINQNEAKKLCNRVNNFRKGNITQKDEEIKSISQKLDAILVDTKIFSSLSHLIKHLAILNMNIEVLNLLDTNKITFGMALIFYKYRDEKFIDGQNFSLIIKHIVSNSMSLTEAKIYFSKFVQKESKEKTVLSRSIKSKLSKLNKISLSLDKKSKKSFESELVRLLRNY
jgi:ParB family chromosome partitioning protein